MAMCSPPPTQPDTTTDPKEITMLHIENLHISFYNEPTMGSNAQGALQQLMTGLGTSQTATSREQPTAQDADATTPPAPGEHWPGQGGIYICTLPAQFGLPARHLVAAAQDTGRHAWGGYDHDTTGATSQTDGRANTAALLADANVKHPAALAASQHTADGHSDFYLPSRFELFMCWLSAPQVFDKEGYYWSSSQYSRGGAWLQLFEYGNSYHHDKDSEHRVRPVRTIHL